MPQCEAITKLGKRCKKQTSKGKTCSIHTKKKESKKQIKPRVTKTAVSPKKSQKVKSPVKKKDDSDVEEEEDLDYDPIAEWEEKQKKLKNHPKLKSNEKLIKYPWGSNFVEWLKKELKKKKISFNEEDTKSDYHEFYIGTTGPFSIDWKHLDESQLDDVKQALLGKGVKMNHKEYLEGMVVSMT